MAELLIPQATDWINALEAGQKSGMTDRMNTAKRSAGGFMASGDYKGAAASLYGAGDFTDASTVAQAGYNQASEAAKVAAKTAVQQKLAAGDFAGAYQAAGTDVEMLGALDKVAAHAKETTSNMAAALQALKGPDGQWLPPDVARQKYAEIKLTLLARGMDPGQVNGFDPTPENLQAIQGQVLGLDKQLEMAKGIAVGKDIVNPYTGKEIHKGDDYQKVGPGETLLNMGGGAGGPAPAPTGGAAAPQMTTAEAPIPTGGVYDQVGQIASGKGASPAEVAYLQRLAQVESHGSPSAQNGKSTGVFQFHPDTFAGLGGKDISDVGQQTAAALALQKRDRANLQQIGIEPTDANAYIMHQQGAGGGRALLTAPPEVNAVAALTPVYGSAKIAEKAIVNNGGTADMSAGDFVKMWQQRWANGGAPVAAHAAAPAAAPTDPRVVFKGTPAWHSDGKGNLINDATGDRKVDPTGMADVQANPDLVKAILEGRAPVPTANRAATDPKWQAAMAAAMAQDPTLDAANYGTRVKTRADFATGAAAKTKTALNTALGHAGDLYSQIDKLGNTGFPDVNMVGNAVGSHFSDARKSQIETFELGKQALMHEAMKVFSGSAGSMSEFEQLANTLNVNDGPKTQHAVLQKLVGLLASKMDALGEQYKTGMGTELDQSQIMSPHAQGVFSKISGLPATKTDPVSPPAAAPKASTAPTAPVHVNSLAEAMALAPGTPFITPDGRHKVR